MADHLPATSFSHANGIHHITSSPYHPSTNGLAERAVQSFKQGLKRMQEESLALKLDRYLFHYRITPHSTTGLSPAELFMGHHPRSVLDLVHPDPVQRVKSRQQQQLVGRAVCPVWQFQVSDKVFVQDFRGPGVRWMPGEVVRVTGPLSYQVRADVGVVRRHVDNIRRRTLEASDAPEEENVIEDFEELTRPTVVDSSIKNPITSPAAVKVFTPSSPVASNFHAEFNSSASVVQDDSIDPDPVRQTPVHSVRHSSRPTSTDCRRSVRHRPPPYLSE